jgi:hypothetical protein
VGERGANGRGASRRVELAQQAMTGDSGRQDRLLLSTAVEGDGFLAAEPVRLSGLGADELLPWGWCLLRS